MAMRSKLLWCAQGLRGPAVKYKSDSSISATPKHDSWSPSAPALPYEYASYAIQSILTCATYLMIVSLCFTRYPYPELSLQPHWVQVAIMPSIFQHVAHIVCCSTNRSSSNSFKFENRSEYSSIEQYQRWGVWLMNISSSTKLLILRKKYVPNCYWTYIYV